MYRLDLERLVLSGGPVGIMQAALEVAADYAHEREQFGQQIGTFQLMQGKLADMYTKTSMCRSYLYTLARAADAGHVSRKDCAAVILLCSEESEKVATEAIQTLGG